MKRLIFLVIIGVSIFRLEAYSQDPTTNWLLEAIRGLNVQNVTLQAAVDAKMEKMVTKLQEESSGAFIQDLQSLRKISKILESMYCQTSETAILIDLMGSNCLLDMEIEMALLNISYSQDLMKTSFLVGFTLISSSQSDKMRFLENIATSLQKSVDIFNNLNSGLKIRLDQKLIDKYLAKQQKNAIRMSAMNRYNNY